MTPLGWEDDFADFAAAEPKPEPVMGGASDDFADLPLLRLSLSL